MQRDSKAQTDQMRSVSVERIGALLEDLSPDLST